MFFSRQQVCLKLFLLTADPIERQSRSDVYISLRESCVVQLHGDGSERENVIVLVLHLLRQEFLVTFSNEIVAPLIYQKVLGKEGLRVVADHAGRETVICGFNVSIAVINPNDFGSVEIFHCDKSSVSF